MWRALAHQAYGTGVADPTALRSPPLVGSCSCGAPGEAPDGAGAAAGAAVLG